MTDSTYTLTNQKLKELYPNPEVVTKIDIEKGIIKISENCFEGFENVETINLTNTLRKIDDYAFKNLKKLNKINFPIQLSNEDFKFNGSKYTFKDNKPDKIFESIELNNLLLTNKITLGNFIFSGCDSLEHIIIPETVLLSKSTFVDYKGEIFICKNVHTIKNLEIANDYTSQNEINYENIILTDMSTVKGCYLEDKTSYHIIEPKNYNKCYTIEDINEIQIQINKLKLINKLIHENVSNFCVNPTDKKLLDKRQELTTKLTEMTKEIYTLKKLIEEFDVLYKFINF